MNASDATGAAKAVQLVLGLVLLALAIAAYTGFTYLRAKMLGIEWVLWPLR